MKRPDPPSGSESWPRPWVELRSAVYHPHVYRSMIRSSDAVPGDIVAVFDKRGERFGSGIFNPRSKISLRMLSFDDRPIDAEFFRGLFERAVGLRHELLRLPEHTDAYRVLHGEGDGLSGLVVDRYGDVLSVQTLSVGVYRRLGEWLPVLEELVGTTRRHVVVDPKIAKLEGFFADSKVLESVRSARIEERGVKFAVDFERGHKTGFFCDQRDNRADFAALASGRSVLDLCSYTGGFAITAKVLGGAGEVTGVDLDEKAIDQARHNANLNQVRIKWVHADAFSYARQMQTNGSQWGALVIDPSKFISSREDEEDGKRKYHDLNRLGLSLVEPGGIAVTCSCSGMLSEADFESIVITAAQRARREIQILRRTGASADHPVMGNCPEGRYLKVLWLRVK